MQASFGMTWSETPRRQVLSHRGSNKKTRFSNGVANVTRLLFNQSWLFNFQVDEFFLPNHVAVNPNIDCALSECSDLCLTSAQEVLTASLKAIILQRAL